MRMNKILFATAFSAALLASTAIHAQSVGVDADADVGVGVGVGTDGTGAGVDAGADANVGAGVGTGSGTEATTGVGVDAEAEVGTATDDVDTQIETGATGSASVSATLTAMGISTEGFFADEAMTELATEAEIRTTFEALPPEQQAELDAECMEVSMASAPDNELMAELCAAIETDTL